MSDNWDTWVHAEMSGRDLSFFVDGFFPPHFTVLCLKREMNLLRASIVVYCYLFKWLYSASSCFRRRSDVLLSSCVCISTTPVASSPVFDPVVCASQGTVWEHMRKRAHAQLVRGQSATVFSDLQVKNNFKKAQAGNEWLNIFPNSSQARKKPPFTSRMRWYPSRNRHSNHFDHIAATRYAECSSVCIVLTCVQCKNSSWSKGNLKMRVHILSLFLLSHIVLVWSKLCLSLNKDICVGSCFMQLEWLVGLNFSVSWFLPCLFSPSLSSWFCSYIYIFAFELISSFKKRKKTS